MYMGDEEPAYPVAVQLAERLIAFVEDKLKAVKLPETDTQSSGQADDQSD